MNNRSSYLVVGPTASGKSDFAHRLAKKIGAVIINCDSVQVYSGIENISASPFAGRSITDEIDGVPYKLFSVLPLSEQISVAGYMDLARREYSAALRAARPVIFVGGTGYYANAVLNGISPMPDIDAATRRRAREMVENDIDAARKLLAPDFAATDPQRVARALEVFLQTGHHLAEFQSASRTGAVVGDARKILINPPAEILRARIAARIPEMISGGAIAEAENIIRNGLDASRAIGAVQLCRYLRGEISRDVCVQDWTTKTNQYAKRQRTWFRTQFTADLEICHAPTDEDVAAVAMTD